MKAVIACSGDAARAHRLVRQDELAELAMIEGGGGLDARLLEAGRLGHRVGVERRLQHGPLPGQNPWLITSCE